MSVNFSVLPFTLILSAPVPYPGDVTENGYFSIPAGVYSSATMNVGYTISNCANGNSLNSLVQFNSDPLITVGSSQGDGSYSNTLTLSSSDLAALNAAAGGNLATAWDIQLSVTLGYLAVGGTITVNSWNLTLTPPNGSGGGPSTPVGTVVEDVKLCSPQGNLQIRMVQVAYTNGYAPGVPVIGTMTFERFNTSVLFGASGSAAIVNGVVRVYGTNGVELASGAPLNRVNLFAVER